MTTISLTSDAILPARVLIFNPLHSPTISENIHALSKQQKLKDISCSSPLKIGWKLGKWVKIIFTNIIYCDNNVQKVIIFSGGMDKENVT